MQQPLGKFCSCFCAASCRVRYCSSSHRGDRQCCRVTRRARCRDSYPVASLPSRCEKEQVAESAMGVGHDHLVRHHWSRTQSMQFAAHRSFGASAMDQVGARRRQRHHSCPQDL
eukprot:2888033-Pleurochrysis_carterae.AAC.1